MISGIHFKVLCWIIVHLSVIILLTALTQIGGLIYILSIYIFRKKTTLVKISFGLLLYFVSVFLIAPNLSKLFGREALPLSGKIAPYTWITFILNRHYVTIETKASLEKTVEKFTKRHNTLMKQIMQNIGKRLQNSTPD